MRFRDAVRRRLPKYPPYYEAPAGASLRLDQNANLFGPHPAVQSRVDLSAAHLYPHRDNAPLLQAAAHFFGTQPEQVFVGNGSDEVLDVVLRTLLDPGARLATLSPSYSLYSHLCRTNRLVHVQIPLGPEFTISAEEILATGADALLLANPNNPTGRVLEPPTLRAILSAFDGPVIIDEAYAEFADASVSRWVDRYTNLVVTRTLSKAAGLAGLRVGFGLADADVAELVRRNKIPFSVNLITEQLARVALADPRPIHETVAKTRQERDALQRDLERLGFQVVPSQANFLLTRPPVSARGLYDALRAQGILARRFADPPLDAYLRFTVPPAAARRRLVDALQMILSPGGSA